MSYLDIIYLQILRNTTHVQTYMSYETFVIVKVTNDREKVNRKCKVEITSTNIFFLRTKY